MDHSKTAGNVNFVICFDFDSVSVPHRTAGYWSTNSTTSFPGSSLSRWREDHRNEVTVLFPLLHDVKLVTKQPRCHAWEDERPWERD